MISIVINLQSSNDNLVAVVKNKQSFFDGFKFETIVFIEEYQKKEIQQETLQELRQVCDRIILHKQSFKFDNIESFIRYKELNYANALQVARGDVIVHFGHIFVYRRNRRSVERLLEYLLECSYVCYPFSEFGVSMEFFACWRNSVDYTEIMKCIKSEEYFHDKYSKFNHKYEHKLSHILGSMSPRGVLSAEDRDEYLFLKSEYKEILPFPYLKKTVERDNLHI